MVKICENSKLRVPTVNVIVGNGTTPDIVPLDPGSADFTSDGYPIDFSPYVLAFIISSDVGYFDSFSAKFTPTTGMPADKIFMPCNIVTNPRGSGLNNYLIYLVQNGVSANGQSNTESFSYGVTYNKYKVKMTEDPSDTSFVIAFDNTGSIDNEPPN